MRQHNHEADHVVLLGTDENTKITVPKRGKRQRVTMEEVVVEM